MSNVYKGWAIGGAILVLLVSISYVYTGRGPQPSNAATQSQLQR
jgi:hypothetical protein